MTHEEKARIWMAENPRAYRLFDKYASQAAATGQKFGAKLIAEQIRWQCFLAKGNERFKFNNNYTAYVARKWAANNPHYAHLLNFREVR